MVTLTAYYDAAGHPDDQKILVVGGYISKAGYFVMHRSIRFWGSRKKNCNLEFVFEDGDKHKGDFIWLMDSAIKASKQVLKPIKPDFEPLKMAPLQAADSVAWANNRVMQVKIGDDTKRLRR